MKTLVNKILQFRDNRDWRQFHTVKNLASSLSIEAAEVLEVFQWKLDREPTSDEKAKLEEELADVFYYLLLLAHESDIDLEQALLKKLEVNERKYPVEKSRGKSTKYTEL